MSRPLQMGAIQIRAGGNDSSKNGVGGSISRVLEKTIGHGASLAEVMDEYRPRDLALWPCCTHVGLLLLVPRLEPRISRRVSRRSYRF